MLKESIKLTSDEMIIGLGQHQCPIIPGRCLMT